MNTYKMLDSCDGKITVHKGSYVVLSIGGFLHSGGCPLSGNATTIHSHLKSACASSCQPSYANLLMRLPLGE